MDFKTEIVPKEIVSEKIVPKAIDAEDSHQIARKTYVDGGAECAECPPPYETICFGVHCISTSQ